MRKSAFFPALLFLIVLMPLNLPAQAAMEDVIYLKDGRVLRGNISQNIPGKFVRIETNDDQSVMLKWDEVDRVASEPVKKSSSRTASSASSGSSGRNSGSSGRNLSSDNRSGAGGVNRGGSSVALATDFEPGYKGLVETGYDFGVSWSPNQFKINVINSYQFIPILITGIGLGTRISYSNVIDRFSFSFPLFADLRAVILEGRFTPYVATGLGTSFNSKFKSLGFFANPGLGVRYWLNDRMGLNFGLNYEVTRRSAGILVLKSEAFGLTVGLNF